LPEDRLSTSATPPDIRASLCSNSFSNQVLAQIELFTKHENYENKVHAMPKHPGREDCSPARRGARRASDDVAAEQADYVNVPVKGLYKADHYRH
jgi:adenosylhomocysteinase